MNIAEREQQILRVKATSFQPELDEALEQALRSAVLEAVKSTLEAALNQEVKAELAKMGKERPLVRVIFNGVSIPNMGIWVICGFPNCERATVSESGKFCSATNGVWAIC